MSEEFVLTNTIAFTQSHVLRKSSACRIMTKAVFGEQMGLLVFENFSKKMFICELGFALLGVENQREI